MTLEQAEAELNVIAARHAADHPDEYPKQFHIQVITVIDWVVGRFRGVLYTLLAAVGLLLLIACCNVAVMGLAACYLPALRALRVDPMQVLRHE